MAGLRYFKISSLLIMILGIIHVLATPVIFDIFRDETNVDIENLYLFIMVGFSVIFIGWLQYFILKSKNYSIILLRIMEYSVLFILILGIGAVLSMWSNPFAYIALALATFQVFQLRKFSNYLNSYFSEHEKE